MAWRIEIVESMSKYGHGLVSVLERLPVGVDVNTIGHSAHHEHMWAKLAQVGNELSDKFLSVDSAVASAHDVDYSLLIEVGVAFVEQKQGGVVALFESLRIVCIVQGNG